MGCELQKSRITPSALDTLSDDILQPLHPVPKATCGIRVTEHEAILGEAYGAWVASGIRRATLDSTRRTTAVRNIVGGIS